MSHTALSSQQRGRYPPAPQQASRPGFGPYAYDAEKNSSRPAIAYNGAPPPQLNRQQQSSTGSSMKQHQHQHQQQRLACSPVSSLSPPNSSASSEPLSYSSLEHLSYDSDCHRGEISSVSHISTDSFAAPDRQGSQIRHAPCAESPDSFGSCILHDPCVTHADGGGYSSNGFTPADTTALKHRLQEIETVLMGPDDGLDTPQMQEYTGSYDAEASGSWTELLGDFLTGTPDRNGPSLQKLAISEASQAPASAAHQNKALSRSMPTASTLPLCSNSPTAISSSATSMSRETHSPHVPGLMAIEHQLAAMSPSARVRKLLIGCATALAEENLSMAESFMQELRKNVSVFGDPMERLAAYMSEGLVARLHASGSFLYKALKCTEAPAADLLSAMQKLYEICPYFKFAYMAANGAIAEACKDESQLHIFDFQIDQGAQWISLMQALASRPGGPPSIRITTVSDPSSPAPALAGIHFVKKRLAKLAASLNLPFEFNIIPAALSELQEHMIERRPGEGLVVNSTLQLHHMPDESVCETNPRDRLLRMIKSLGPKVLTLVEQEANTNTAPFLPRFMETLDYYSAVFESIDVALPRESKDRVNVEEQCLARDIVNVIACEGRERVERHELTGKWRMRMMMAGYKPHPLSSHVNQIIEALLASYSSSYRLQDDGGALLLGWLNRPLVAASAWQ